MTIFRSIFILFCMVLLSAAPLRAGVVDIAPTHDAQVVEGRSTTNYGDRTNIYLASAAGGSYKNERGWLRFDLTKQVPPGATIVSAKLRFYCYSADSDQDMEAAVHGSSDDTWQEMAINWSNQPALAGPPWTRSRLKQVNNINGSNGMSLPLSPPNKAVTER